MTLWVKKKIVETDRNGFFKLSNLKQMFDAEQSPYFSLNT